MMEGDKHLKRQLDTFEDHRPYFTYWTCTVQILIMVIALITYGLGPVGFNLHRRSGLVCNSVLIYSNTSKATQPCLGLLEKVLLEKRFFLEKGDGARYAIKF